MLLGYERLISDWSLLVGSQQHAILQHLERLIGPGYRALNNPLPDQVKLTEILPAGFTKVISVEPLTLKKLYLTREQDRYSHEWLYDARLRFTALSDALSRSCDGDTIDIYAFLKAWYENAPLEKASRDAGFWRLKEGLASLLKAWCVRGSIPYPLSGVKGVSYDAKRNKWDVRVTINGKRTRLGRYDTEGEAALAVLNHDYAAWAAMEAWRDQYIGVSNTWFVSDPEPVWHIYVPYGDAARGNRAQAFLKSIGQAYNDKTRIFCVRDSYTAGAIVPSRYADHEARWRRIFGNVDAGTRASFSVEGKEYAEFGRFGSAHEAAIAYDTFARQYLENPRLNFST